MPLLLTNKVAATTAAPQAMPLVSLVLKLAMMMRELKTRRVAVLPLPLATPAWMKTRTHSPLKAT
jgi:hypothetical protein